MFGIDSGVLVVIGVLLVLAAIAAKFFSGKSSAPHGHNHDHTGCADHDHGPVPSDNFGEYHPRPSTVGCKFDPEVVRKSAAERSLRDNRPPLDLENLPAPDARIQKRLVCVSETEVRDILLGLSGEKPVYIAGNAVTIKSRSSYGQGVMDAMAYVEQFYKSLGIPTRRIPYKVRGRTFFVLEAEHKGTKDPNKVLVIGSHLDSTAGNTWGEERVAPGADDDASGTTSVMLLAAQLKELSFDYTIRFLHFTGEEQGLWGSFAYVNFLETQEKHIDVICMYQLDMVGYTKSSTANRVDIHDSVDRNGSHVLVEVLARMVKVYNLNLAVEDTHNHAVDERSDHGPFQRKGKKAVLVSEEFTDDGFNPNYHSTNDRVATVNIPYMVEIIRAMIPTAAHWAGLK